MRLIDGDALIAKWEEEVKHIEAFDHRGMVYGAINDVKRQPTIEAPRWIPVTERLPEPYCGAVLVTVNDGSVYVDVMSYDSPGDGHTYNSMFYTADSDGYPEICEDVVAWMPLPKPWEGEEDE